MGLTPAQRRGLNDALLSAFTSWGELEAMVKLELGVDLAAEVGREDRPLKEVVLSLIDWAESYGRIQDLIRGASMQNPGNPDLQQFVTTFRPVQFDPLPAQARRYVRFTTLGICIAVAVILGDLFYLHDTLHLEAVVYAADAQALQIPLRNASGATIYVSDMTLTLLTRRSIVPAPPTVSSIKPSPIVLEHPAPTDAGEASSASGQGGQQIFSTTYKLNINGWQVGEARTVTTQYPVPARSVAGFQVNIGSLTNVTIKVDVHASSDHFFPYTKQVRVP